MYGPILGPELARAVFSGKPAPLACLDAVWERIGSTMPDRVSSCFPWWIGNFFWKQLVKTPSLLQAELFGCMLRRQEMTPGDCPRNGPHNSGIRLGEFGRCCWIEGQPSLETQLVEPNRLFIPEIGGGQQHHVYFALTLFFGQLVHPKEAGGKGFRPFPVRDIRRLVPIPLQLWSFTFH